MRQETGTASIFGGTAASGEIFYTLRQRFGHN